MLVSIFVNSIVEILGLAVVVPVIGLVVQPETIQTNPTLKSAFDVVAPLGINTPSRFLIALCGLMIGAFLFKAIFGLAVNLFQTRFSFRWLTALSGQMWSYHFSQSLQGHAETDSGTYPSEINVWPEFANAFMVGGLMMVNEFMCDLFIAIGLLIYNSIVFLSIAALMGFGAPHTSHCDQTKRLSAYSDIRQMSRGPTTSSTMPSRGFSKSSLQSIQRGSNVIT